MNQAMSNPAAKADRIQNTWNVVNPYTKTSKLFTETFHKFN